MLIIGHRGASGLEPENTIRSFKKAEELKVDMIEMDLRESKDGQVIIFHDHSLKRLFGINKAVKHLTVVELKEISISREIPTLDEVLSTINSDLQLDVKVHGLEEKILAKIKNFPHKVLISSFYPKVLKKIRALDGNIPLALVIPIKKFHLIAIANFLTRKLNLEAIHPRNYIVSLPLIALFRRSGKKINAWTVNSESEYRRMQKLGIDGIFTDCPQLFFAQGGPASGGK